MYFCIEIILNGVANAPPIKLSQSLDPRNQGFLHSNQNNARAYLHQLRLGSCKELPQIYIIVFRMAKR